MAQLRRARPETWRAGYRCCRRSQHGAYPAWEVHETDAGFTVLKVWRWPEDHRERASVELPTSTPGGATLPTTAEADALARFFAAVEIAGDVERQLPDRPERILSSF